MMDEIDFSIGPKGNAASTKAVTSSAKSLLLKFLETRTVSGVSQSLNFSTNIDVIATTACMEQFAGYLYNSKWGKKSEYYSHTSVEVYFNKVVAIVEEAANIKFCDNWQSKVCENLIRLVVNRKISEGFEESVKMAAGRSTTSAISKALFLENKLDSIEARASIVVEFKDVGR